MVINLRFVQQGCDHVAGQGANTPSLMYQMQPLMNCNSSPIKGPYIMTSNYRYITTVLRVSLMSVDRLMFAVYMLFTSLVLVSLLIAMATNRYEGAKRRAECTWRFNAVVFGLRIERLLAAAVAITGCQLCSRDQRPLGRLAQSYPDPIFDGRYLLDVRQKTAPPPTTTTVNSEQRRLRDDVSRLNAQVRDIANRIDLLAARLH